MNNPLEDADAKLQKAIDHLTNEFKTIRSGRASTAMVEGVIVNVYSQQMPLKQLASISTPEATTITITAWDAANTDAIEKAIREDQALDMNPVSDGKVIHINIPSPTAERREHLVKQVAEKVEQCNIALRNIRHELLNEAKKLNKDKSMSDDEYHALEKQLDSKLDEAKKSIEELAEHKRKEIREV